MAAEMGLCRRDDDGVGQSAEPGHFDLDDVAQLHRPRERRRAGEDDIAREQRDVPAQIGELVVDAERRLGDRA
jgi:hypothetical protein